MTNVRSLRMLEYPSQNLVLLHVIHYSTFSTRLSLSRFEVDLSGPYTK